MKVLAAVMIIVGLMIWHGIMYWLYTLDPIETPGPVIAVAMAIIESILLVAGGIDLLNKKYEHKTD